MKKNKNNYSIYPKKKLNLDFKGKKRYLTIEEKKQLALKGENVPVCAYRD